jgi:predicted  nucleic acid-binding Zn-ribbon protein
MLDIMGITTSALSSSFSELFGGIDEDVAMSEFDDIRERLRACEADYTRFQTEKTIIPSKLAHLKNAMSTDNKLYTMVNVLDDEWNSLNQRVQKLVDNQTSASTARGDYAGW